jgi:hypothetical protein
MFGGIKRTNLAANDIRLVLFSEVSLDTLSRALAFSSSSFRFFSASSCSRAFSFASAFSSCSCFCLAASASLRTFSLVFAFSLSSSCFFGPPQDCELFVRAPYRRQLGQVLRSFPRDAAPAHAVSRAPPAILRRESPTRHSKHHSCLRRYPPVLGIHSLTLLHPHPPNLPNSWRIRNRGIRALKILSPRR